MSLMTSDIRAWLSEALPEERFFTGPNLPKFPTRHAVITRSAGGGLEMEFAIANPSWQIHVIGPQSRDDRVNAASEAAEELIMAIEAVILNTPYPLDLGEKRIISAQPFGAGPSPISPDTAGRTHFVATYIFRSPSGYA